MLLSESEHKYCYRFENKSIQPRHTEMLDIIALFNVCIINVMHFQCLLVSSRDGPEQSYPQLGIFSGNTALESAYSSFNQVLIKFHSDFSTSGFFVLNFHG